LSPNIKYKHVLLKFSGEFLGDSNGQNININSLLNIIKEIKPLIDLKVQIGIVLGAGNIFRGSVIRQKEKFARTFTQTEADKAGMLGTVINSLLFSDMLSQEKIKNRIFSTLFIDSLPFFNAKDAIDSLKNGYVNIYAGGTSNPFVTTDTSAVLKALETNADILIKATKVDGVFDKDPVKYKDAEFFKDISYISVIEKKLKVMDLTSLSMAMENDLPITVMNFFKKGNILKLVQGHTIGTFIH